MIRRFHYVVLQGAALLSLVLGATRATAQSTVSIPPEIFADPLDLTTQPRLPRDSTLALRSSESIMGDGSKARIRGIVLRQELGTNVTLGFGLMGMKPRRSSLSPDPELHPGSRGSRKAAVRLTVKF